MNKATSRALVPPFRTRTVTDTQVALDTMPLNGRIVLRTPQERLDEMRDGENRDGQENHATGKRQRAVTLSCGLTPKDGILIM